MRASAVWHFWQTHHYRGVFFIHIQGLRLHHYIVKYVTRERFSLGGHSGVGNEQTVANSARA